MQSPPPQSGWIAPRQDLKTAWEMLISSWLNVLLLLLPLGFASGLLGWPASATFILVRVAVVAAVVSTTHAGR